MIKLLLDSTKFGSWKRRVGELNFHINWDPSQWNTPGGAPFDILKTEALDFGSGSRDMNLAKETVEFYRTDGRNWPQDKTRHLIAVFNGGCPWKREYWLARNEQTPKILYWAFDQLCLFSWQRRPAPGRPHAEHMKRTCDKPLLPPAAMTWFSLNWLRL